MVNNRSQNSFTFSVNFFFVWKAFWQLGFCLSAPPRLSTPDTNWKLLMQILSKAAGNERDWICSCIN